MTTRKKPGGLRALLLRLHFYAGVFVGPFILIAAVTGLLYAVIPQVDNAVYRHELTVDRVGEQRLPLADQVAAVRAAHPVGAVESIRPPAAADETTQVRLLVDDVPPGYARTVFVDPYTAELRGALTTYGQWMPLRAWFDELHRTLHLDEIGRNYSELAASWLWVISLAGLVLWYLHRRDTQKLRRLALPDRDKKDRRRTLSWHGAVGVWILVALLGLSVTGITWSRYGGQSVDLIQQKLNTAAPTVDTALGPRTGSEAALSYGADTAWRTAERVGLHGPLWMYPPAQGGQGWRVEENKRDWPTRHDAISVDPDTGAVTDRVNFTDWPFLAKLTDWAIDAHMGVLFGWPNQIFLALTAIGLITIVIRGYQMWWQRRPTRGSQWAVGPPPLRGAIRNLPPTAGVALVVAAAALGWFLPLFGLSLAAFVVVDLVIGAVKQRRGAAEVKEKEFSDA
ncbi:PepSY-associated TM helix domain-containing protein [Mycolicibacterium holsaticum]|uniref:PepSY-associated TM helix domain-containing protein n=1 Tax=Mycolicibacterium holsaticum TaxID=152142 RepID=UPI001C7D8F04|nr:PepSY-associated TM helix domain-containing protein [Mycolicibacterium holsaticum]MDA4106413.1 peptidase [Mycolicibacterium holsaticum DSM 44478 = JCM 12374]QZA13281.1 PepSY domain-containing protein [Mycolicibacterium holsaticum DSM 44478 = JCM 12374]UNC09251.1 PepSY domain-containing protein [Mycolicibacterium holsaticum DSM 44478 = JCM 12374]